MKNKLFLILLMTIQTIYCQTISKSNLTKLNKSDFNITYPNNLKLDESGKNGTVFFLFTEKTNPNDNFIENINLIIQDLSKMGINLDKYVEISEKQIVEIGKISESKRMTKESIEFQRIIFDTSLNNLNLKFIQYYFIKNDKAYVLTFTCNKEEFITYSEEMENVMKSFTLN